MKRASVTVTVQGDETFEQTAVMSAREVSTLVGRIQNYLMGCTKRRDEELSRVEAKAAKMRAEIAGNG